MEDAVWSDFAKSLLHELAKHPGRIALVADGPQDAMERLARALGGAVLLAGRVLTEFEQPPDRFEILTKLEGAVLLDDIEILFTPELGLNPLRLLHDLARRGPRITRWPGTIRGTRATYSEPGRRDYYEAQLSNTVILRPRQTHFPDEIPFLVQRVP